MSGINKAIILGNLGADPETRYTGAGVAVANFSVATSERWKDKQSGEVKERTEWHRCVAFGRVGEIAGEYLQKGSKVYVEGSIETSSYEKDGQTRYSTQIKVRDLQMLDSRPDNRSSGSSSAPQGSEGQGGSRRRPAASPQQNLDDFDDDIPF